MDIYSRDLMNFDEYISLQRAQARASSQSAFSLAIANLQLGKISQDINELKILLGWGMGEILLRLDMQQDALKSIKEQLQAPLDTQAKELRRRAEYAYDNGWFDDALIDFLESEKKNYQDFWVHQAIANIYLYHHDPPELQKARDYYLKLGKYATPVARKVAAKGYLYAGFVCYLLHDDQSAITNAQKAIELAPDLTEAFYNLAKFAAAAGRPDLAIPNLETAICRDRKYYEVINQDAEFAKIARAVMELMAKLQKEALLAVFTAYMTCEKQVTSDLFSHPKVRARADEILRKAKEKIAVGTYLDCLDAQLFLNDLMMLTQEMIVTLTRHHTATSQDQNFIACWLYRDTIPIGHRFERFQKSLYPGDTVSWKSKPGPHILILSIIDGSLRSGPLHFIFDLFEDIEFVCGVTPPKGLILSGTEHYFIRKAE
jgi:tetratricopeptide (TPR) repeat protein